MRMLTVLLVLMRISEVAAGQSINNCYDDGKICDITAVLEIGKTSACSYEIRAVSDLSFGGLYKPKPGLSGTMTLSPNRGSTKDVTGVTLDSADPPRRGELSVVASGGCSCSLFSKGWSNVLTHEDEPEETITYESQYSNPFSSGFDFATPAEGELFFQIVVSAGTEWNWPFWFGGTISGITSESPLGEYTGTISLMLLCS